MDPVLMEIAKARKVAKSRNEKFVRIPNELLAVIVARLMGKAEEPTAVGAGEAE
jgi:hypothetical protein